MSEESKEPQKGEVKVPGAVAKISIEGKHLYLKQMDRHTLELAFQEMSKGKTIRAGETILKNTVIEGASDWQEIASNDQLLIPASLKAFELVDFKSAELEKL